MAEIENLHVYTMEVYAEQQEQISILMEGDYGYPLRHFAIIRTRIGHPCAYIEAKPDDYAVQDELEDGFYDNRYDHFDIRVHGGPTYYGEAYWSKEDQRNYIGWDYAHYGDYDTYCASIYGYDNGHRWNLWEILADVVEACGDIRRQNNKHWGEMHALPIERDGT